MWAVSPFLDRVAKPKSARIGPQKRCVLGAGVSLLGFGVALAVGASEFSSIKHVVVSGSDDV